MTAPNIISVQHDGTTLYVIFDRAIQATGGSELDGFTFTKTPGPIAVVPVFSSIDQNALIATLPSSVGAAETLNVDYVSGSGTITDAATGLDPATSFNVDAVAYFSSPLIRRATAGEGSNDLVKVYLSEPVASPTDDLLTGLTIEVDDVALDLTGATVTLNSDQTILTIDTGSNFVYNDVVDVIYDDGVGDLYTWPTGALASFTLNAVDNLSTDGLPDGDYPLSVAIGKQLEVVQNVAKPCINIYLNPIDIELVQKYGPVRVFTGGTFGVTVGNPSGITVAGGFVEIVDGAQVKIDFNDPASTVNSVDAATDWLSTIITKIGVELGKVRSTDQGITIGNRTINQV